MKGAHGNALRNEGPGAGHAAGMYTNSMKRRKTAPTNGGVRILILLAPGLLMLSVLTLYPIAKMLIMSFFDWKIGFRQVSTFVGLRNYRVVLSDPIAIRSLVNTLFYLVATVPAQMALGLLVALLIHGIHKGSVLLRLLYYLPVVTSWVVVALLFRYIFSNNGLLNYLLVDVIGVISQRIGWLGSRWSALTATSLLGVWKGIGWNMVVFLAALQAVPREYYEAAAIDGASTWQRFFRISLPNIRGSILFASVMLTIGAFNTFTPIAVMTEGNPAHQTEVVLTWMYSQTFDSMRMGYSAALSMLLTVMIAVFTVVLFVFLRDRGTLR
jgi:multiple sugar transport system permease protein